MIITWTVPPVQQNTIMTVTKHWEAANKLQVKTGPSSFQSFAESQIWVVTGNQSSPNI
jgi:hypothetical protein